MEQNCEIGLRLDIIVDIIGVYSVWNEKSERIRDISLLSLKNYNNSKIGL